MSVEAMKDKPCDFSSVPPEVATDPVVEKVPEDAKDPKVSSECPSPVVVSAAEVESGVDKKSSDEVKMSVEARKDEPVYLSLVPPEVATDPVVRASHPEVDKLPGEGVPPGDDVSAEVVPSQEKGPENASDPKSSCVSPALVSAVEGATGVPKKQLSEDEVSTLIMNIDAVHSKIASFGAPGQFQSVDDVLNEVRQLREQVQEGERTIEGKLKEVKTENDLLKLKADELQEKYNDKDMELKVFKLGFKEQIRNKAAVEDELSQLKVQLQAKDDDIFESRTYVSGLVDIIEGKEETEAIYLKHFRTAGEAMLKAMVVAGSFLPPKKSVLEDLKKVSAATGVRLPYADLHELCEGGFVSENVRLPEEPKQGTSKQAKLVHSKRAESVGSGSTTEPTKFSRTDAPRKGPKSKKRSGRPKSRIAEVSSRESSESDRQVPESPDDFQRKERKEGRVGVKGGGRRRGRSTSSTKSTDALEVAASKLKKEPGSQVSAKKIKVEEGVDADVENPAEPESMFTKDGLYDKRQIVLELQSGQFLCGVCYRNYTSKHTWLRHACKHDLHFIQDKEVKKYGADIKGKTMVQHVKKGFCKYCSMEADAFAPEQKYYDLYNKDAMKAGWKAWVADETARGEDSYVKKLKKP